jgi:hypothetical protein
MSIAIYIVCNLTVVLMGEKYTCSGRAFSIYKALVPTLFVVPETNLKKNAQIIY